jgi:glutamate-ammonia-ligase adenylyltransferase
MHGHATPGVRTPNTLEAIDALKAAGIIGRTDAAILREGYLFFRRLIDGLRIVRGHAKDLVLPPPDSDAFVFLARRIGYTSESWAEGAKKLEGDVTRFMTWTRDFYDTRFGGR